MFFKQIYETGLAHASYMIGCQQTGECLVIDAKRDVDTYQEIAKQERLKITHLAETHIHADFLSGTRELAKLTNAPMYLSDEGGKDWQYEFEHIGVRDGSSFMVGNIKVDVMHTPGHTPEHICFLVTDTPATADVPIMMFTGDFVFVGDVGRPDLLEKAAGIAGTMELGARQMWESLKRFKALPDHIQVHPAHGAGSACGKALGSIPSSTVGYEKLVNWALRSTDEELFVQDLLSGQPEPPKYFATMKRLNKVDRPLLTHVPEIKLIGLADLDKALANKWNVVDTRPKVAFATGHIPGTISIPNNKAFSGWAGWVLNYNDPFVVITSADKSDDVMRRLMRIGLDNVAGALHSVNEWTDAGRELEATPQMQIDELQQRYSDEDVVVLDVRPVSDYVLGLIPGSINIHTGLLVDHLDEIPRDKSVVLSCQSGDRSNIGTSILMREGFTNVLNFPGGWSAWERSSEERAARSEFKAASSEERAAI